MFKKFAPFIFAVFAIVSLYGCAKSIETEHEAGYYKEIGDEYFSEKNYRNAINYYESALMRAESPDDASKIQIALANSYFLSKQYVEAIPVYEVYLDYYGNSPEANVAILRIGMSHYELMRRPPQDQTQTITALKYFEQVKERDPALAKESDLDTKIADIFTRLAEKEYIIARYYGRILEHRSSMLRYKYLVDHYPKSPRYQLSSYRLIKLLLRFDNISEAENYFTLLKTNFPDSKYIKDAEDAFHDKKKENAKKAELLIKEEIEKKALTKDTDTEKK